MALLGYLVAERRPIGREHLALLFWPDEAPSRGRGNLRRELHNLTQILPDCWELNRQSVAFIPSANTIVDLYKLLQLEEQERWGEAAKLLGGEFLEGLYLDHNPEFENWLLGERERWRGRAETVLPQARHRGTHTSRSIHRRSTPCPASAAARALGRRHSPAHHALVGLDGPAWSCAATA